MNKATIFAAVLLAGCAGGGGDGGGGGCVDIAHEYGYDVTGDTGLTLLATTPEVAFISFEQMEAEYIDLEKCMVDNNTPGPTVQFLNFDTTTEYVFPLRYALYYYALQTVFIDTAIDDRPMRNCISDREFLRHEFGHHVLYMNGLDSTHANPLFEQCDALGPKTCNGEYCD